MGDNSTIEFVLRSANIKEDAIERFLRKAKSNGGICPNCGHTDVISARGTELVSFWKWSLYYNAGGTWDSLGFLCVCGTCYSVWKTDKIY